MAKDAKRILIVLNSAWNIYNFRLPLMRFLHTNGYEVIAIAPKDGYEHKIVEEGFRFHELKLSAKSTNPFKDFQTCWQLFNLYKNLQPSCVLHYTVKPNIYGSIAAYCSGTTSIATVTGLGTLFLSNNFASRIGRWLYRVAFWSASKVFFQNLDDLNLFVSSKLVSSAKSMYIPGSGIDTKKFSPSKIEIPDKPFIFLLIARILWDKGIGEYIEAARILKKNGCIAEYWLLGDSNADNPSIIPQQMLLGWKKEGIINHINPVDDVREYISKAHCVVLPSYREGLPRTLLEAASMEKPLIATNVPGCKDVIENELNGFLCEAKNSQQLAKAMLRMYSLPKLELAKMGEYSRVKVCREFDETFVLSRYLDNIKRITKN